jgi:hypothetical protein
MAYDSMTTALKPSILGYISKGEMVPDVMITELNLSKTGFIAIAASKQVRWMTGLGTVAVSVSNGSTMSKKPVS